MEQNNKYIFWKSIGLAVALQAALTTTLLAEDVLITSADVDGDTVWTSDNTYILTEVVYVEDQETLTIQAGTVIKGQPGTGAETKALVVAPGGKIFANGTPSHPIIMTAEADDMTDPFDLGKFDRGLWGGLILLGKAPLNSPIGTSPITDSIEGLPVGDPRNVFGGSDENDNSGVLRFVSVRHAGSRISPNNEVNGVTFGGVGRGTLVEYIETYATADDGFEWFGGTVDSRYLVSAFNDDDAFDYDQGFRGRGQFWFAIQEPGKHDLAGEHDGDVNTFDLQPYAIPVVYNATYIGSGVESGTGNIFNIRDGAGAKYYNSIFTDFGARGIRIDDTSVPRLDAGDLDFRSNLFWGFGGGNTVDNLNVLNAEILFTDTARDNQIVDPMLRSINREEEAMLDPRPAAGSPALSAGINYPAGDDFFMPVDFKGAFASDLWINGWTYLSQREFTPVQGENIIEVSNADIDGDVTWTMENSYVLTEVVYVEDGETLTIEPGTVIKGKPGTGAETKALVVAPGGKIFANGTAINPIIMTAEADDVQDPYDMNLFERGLWGGFIILGRAPLNSPIGNTPITDSIEGLPVGDPRNVFGGSDENDSSGVIRYVSVRHAGSRISPNNEVNGVTFGGVGRGTVVEYVEAYATADDGFEWFGGTVDAKYLISAFNDDDSFDYDQGFRGRGQFWFAIQEPGKHDLAGEHDGDVNTFDLQPYAIPVVYNATYIGSGVDSGTGNVFNIRDGAGAKYYNSIFTDFGAGGIRIDDTSVPRLNAGDLDFQDNLWWGFGGGNTAENLNVLNAAILFSDDSRDNDIMDPMLNNISREDFFELDPRPAIDSPAWTTDRAPSGDFYSEANYKGAFGHRNWAADWSYLQEIGVLTGAGAGVRAMTTTNPEVGSVLLSISAGAGEVTISFMSQTGVTYQAMMKDTLSGAWTNIESLTGNGDMMSFTHATSNPQGYFRVVAQ